MLKLINFKSITNPIAITYRFFVLLSLLLLITACKEDSSKKQSSEVISDSHPNLILTQNAVSDIKKELGNVPIFDATLSKTKKEIDEVIAVGIDVPIPKDMAGGYTHTQHKANYGNMQKAGVLFQIFGDEKYAVYVRDMLLQYAKMYPTLGRHPQLRSYARGKFFWQCLNDSNWLVYTSQAYDCIYDWLPEAQTDYLNKTLFRPYADFLSIETPQYFNRIHNHSTWGNVAVGLIGLVMDDEELVQRALYGLSKDDVDLNQKDNDGGFIYDKEGKSGFLANLDQPFSPDGFYTEGPYYQRYAMYPFMIFAEALENKKPELKIFEYKDGVLLKAMDALLNLTDADGEFFPLNDCQKGMSYYTTSLVSALNIAYYYGDQKPELLSVAKTQNKVQLDASGLAVAMGIRGGKAKPFMKTSVELSDGANGDEGAVGILRYNDSLNTMALVMKYTGQGLSHGHYDKLSFSFYENGEEVLQDYGLSRYVNVEQKNGGGYLKENKTWAKQTIAHNTIIQDETSHFSGDFATGSKNHSEKYVYDASNTKVQVMSAKENNAYPGTNLHRTMIMIKEDDLEKPFVIDLFRVNSNKTHQFDLPYYYFGQIIAEGFDAKVPNSLSTLGAKNGYQHLWEEASGKSETESLQFTWLNNRKFYGLTTATKIDDTILLARLGGNDPKFNLRNDPAFILRRNAKETIFATIIESHGNYNPVTEKAKSAYSAIKELKILFNSETYSALSIDFKSGERRIFIMSNDNASYEASHVLEIEGETYSWTGTHYYN